LTVEDQLLVKTSQTELGCIDCWNGDCWVSSGTM